MEKVINDISGSFHKSNNIDNSAILNNNKMSINNNKEKADIFNNFFSNIGTKMTNKIPPTKLPDKFTSNDKVESNIFFKPVNNNEILLFISLL